MNDLVEAAKAELARRQSAQPSQPAPNPLVEAARAELQRRRDANGGAPGDWTQVASFEDNGRVFELPDGTFSAVSNGFSTSDQERIAEIMQGATPMELVQGDIDRERIAANPIAARGNELIRGVPFVGSYTDDAVRMVSPQAADNMEAMSGAMERQNPNETAALNLTGAVAGAAPAVLAAAPAVASRAAASLGGRAVQAATAGAAAGGAEGAIYGYGEGQGDERSENALAGGKLGAAFGGVAGLAAPYAATGIRALMQRYGKSDISVIARDLGVSRDAARVVRDALASGDPQEAQAALARAGDSAMLSEANSFTRNLIDTAAQTPGAAGDIARNAVQERVGQSTQQMIASLDDVLGQPRGANEIMGEIRANARPTLSREYDAAYAAPIDYASSLGQQLEGMLSRVPESAIRRANELMRIRGEESAQILARVGDDGRISLETLPDVRQLDYITRALNDVASEADGAGKLGGQTDLGMSVQGLSRSIRNSMRGLVPEYGAALDSASDAITQRNGVQTGYELLRAGTRREDIGQAVNGASQAELASMRQGVRSFIDDVTANVTRTITDNDVEAREGIQILRQMSSRGNQTKLRMLLGTDNADRLLGEIDQAATSFELRAAIAQNSRTMARQVNKEVMDDITAPNMLQLLAQGEPINASKRFVQSLTGQTPEAIQIRQMGIYEEIAQALTGVRGVQAQRSLQMINRAIAGQDLNERQAGVIADAVVGTLGAGGVPTAHREVLPN